MNFWAFLNSSLLKLYREISGRKSLGGGLLKAEATDLSIIQIYHEFKEYDKIKKIFEIYKNKEVENIQDTLNDPNFIKLDDIVLKFFKIEKYANKLRELLIKKVNLREKKSTT